MQNGEKLSKYFCSLEKQNYIEKTIKRTQLDCGKVVIDQKNILMEVRKFYSILFSIKAIVLDNLELGHYTQGKDFVKLRKSDSESLEGELTLCEIGEALRKLKNNKCPGIDGFSSEFFKFFWPDLKHFIHKSLNSAYDRGEMSISFI